MRMLDLFAGLGGASQAMKDRGWDVVTVDNNPDFSPDILADIKTWEWGGSSVDLVWASPPCEEFSREFMPWSKTGNDPSMELLAATIRLIGQIKPRFWIIENTRGAVKWFKTYLGPPAWISNPVYLWGVFPPLDRIRLNMGKEKLSSTKSAERAKIPYQLSLAVARSIEGVLL